MFVDDQEGEEPLAATIGVDLLHGRNRIRGWVQLRVEISFDQVERYRFASSPDFCATLVTSRSAAGVGLRILPTLGCIEYYFGRLDTTRRPCIARASTWTFPRRGPALTSRYPGCRASTIFFPRRLSRAGQGSAINPRSLITCPVAGTGPHPSLIYSVIRKLFSIDREKGPFFLIW